MVGKTVSHYRILDLIGQGGMGLVYRAEDIVLGRPVALKFLPRGLESLEAERARFLQEARAASALNHPNVCTIHEISEHEGQLFIVMEFIEGVTLRAKIASGPPAFSECIDYALQIGEALHEAHGRGIVHRDIKSENIMVTPPGRVKVMDFGLAKLKGVLRPTRTSSTAGTLAYMAPEQIQGGVVDTRTDIFSYGVVLYEMLTGRFPFSGDHEAAVMYSILNEEPEPLQRYLPDISSDLVHIINRALDKDPEDRYQSVHDMVIDIRRLKKQTGRVVRPPTSDSPGIAGTSTLHSAATRRWRSAKVLGPLAGLLIVILSAILLTSRGAPRLSKNPVVRTLEVPLSQIEYPSISRDGNWIAFIALDESGKAGVYFMSVAKGQPRRLTTDPYRIMGYAEISPDGSEILYDGTPPGDDNGIYIVPSLGGAGRRIARPGVGPRWRPDGRLIGYIREGNPRDAVPSQSGKREFWTVGPDGNDNRLVFVDSLSYVQGNWCFDWSPDGRAIAWLRSFPGYEEVFVRQLASGAERQLTAFRKPITEIAWASNDEIFMATSKGGNSNIWAIPASGGEAIQVTRGSGPDVGIRVSADVTRLLIMEQRDIAHLWTCSAGGGDARQITFDEHLLFSPQFSPDGRRISVTITSEDYLVRGNRIVVYEGDGSPGIQIASAEASHYFATWSPDGRRLAYGSRRLTEPEDSSRVFVVDLAAPDRPRFVGKGLVGIWIDQDHLVTETWVPAVHSTLYSVSGGSPVQDYEDSTHAYPLPGGRHIAVHDLRGGREGWWLKSAAHPSQFEPRLLLPADSSMWPHLTPNLRYVVYEWPVRTYWRMSLPEGKRERVPRSLEQLGPEGMWLTMSLDGSRWLFTRRRFDTRLVLMENVFE